MCDLRQCGDYGAAVAHFCDAVAVCLLLPYPLLEGAVIRTIFGICV